MLKSYYNQQAIEAGMDEVGRGCLAGPVVAAAVILPPGYLHPSLNDSKKLSAEQRTLIQADIKKDALAWAIAEVSHEEIDRINILRASIMAMHLAVDKLTLRPEHLLVDGNRFIPYPMIPHTCIIKGDSKFLSIAAASVLAKCYRDELMTAHAHTYPHYGWHRNVGYPTKQHRKAIETHGICVLHRKSFKLTGN